MIYFDITDLFSYLRKNRNVTGIQRVQMKILHALTVRAPEQIKCLVIEANASSKPKLTIYDAADLFASEVETTALIRELLRQEQPTRLLDPAGVRAALQPHNHRKLYRGLKKIELYASRIIAPRRLARLGYKEEHTEQGRQVRQGRFPGALPGDVYVILGHNWATPEINALASSFRSAGGHAIQVIHDIIPAKKPTFFPAKAAKEFETYLNRCKEVFSSFVAVSENTRRDLLSHFNGHLNPGSVRVLRLAHAFAEKGRNASCASPHSRALTSLAGKQFVVSVGTIEPRKNQAALIRVWAALYKHLGASTPILVLAGKLGWKTEAFLQELANASRQGAPVMHLPTADDQDLHFLYANCRFSVYPSLYEGWGLPVGESLWLGRPCLASSASSIPEVSTEGVEYFDPHDENDMLSHVRRLCDDEALLADLTQKAKKAKLRDWNQVAHELMALVDSAAREGVRSSTKATEIQIETGRV